MTAAATASAANVTGFFWSLRNKANCDHDVTLYLANGGKEVEEERNKGSSGWMCGARSGSPGAQLIRTLRLLPSRLAGLFVW